MPVLHSEQSAVERDEEVAMHNDASIETLCSDQHEQHLLDVEHRLREAIRLAREQLMQCQQALEQLSKVRRCSLLRRLSPEWSSVCEETTSQVRFTSYHDNLGCAPPAIAPADALTPREAEVLQLISAGMSNRAIADALFLSPRTVERHIANIYLKIDVHSKAEATAFALHYDFARIE